MAHTKGEWKLKTNRQLYCNNKHIATIHYGGERGMPSEKLDKANANARLISAAPDLLEACEKCYMWLDDPDSADYGEMTLMEVLQQAISKAEDK